MQHNDNEARITRSRRVTEMDRETAEAFGEKILYPVLQEMEQANGLVQVNELDHLHRIAGQPGLILGLVLDDCAVNPEASRLVGEAISGNPNLQILGLDLQHLVPRKPGDMKMIMDAVKVLPNLKFLSLNLSGLKLDHEEIDCIVDALTSCKKSMAMMHLALHKVDMSAESVIRLLHAVRIAKPDYGDIELFEPMLDASGMDRVLQALRGNTALTRLQFTGAELTPQQESIRAMCVMRNQLLFKYREQPEICERILRGCEDAGLSNEPVPKLRQLVSMFAATDVGKAVVDPESQPEDIKDFLKILCNPDEITDQLIQERDELAKPKK